MLHAFHMRVALSQMHRRGVLESVVATASDASSVSLADAGEVEEAPRSADDDAAWSGFYTHDGSRAPLHRVARVISDYCATPTTSPVARDRWNGADAPILQAGRLGGSFLAPALDGEMLELPPTAGDSFCVAFDPSLCTCGSTGRPHRRSDATVLDWPVHVSPMSSSGLAPPGPVVIDNYWRS
jgi:hypothetical protein